MSKRFEIDMGLNASDVAKGAKDAESALADLEQAVGDVGNESRDAGGDISDFTRKLVTAARDAGKSDDEIRDALRKYGVNAKEAERAIEGIGDEFKDTGRDGERALDDLEDSLRDVQRQTEKLGDDTAGAGRKMKRGLDDAGEGLGEFKDEANSTAREAAASFDGSAESIADAFQEVAANAFAGFGPAGAVAGLAAAAGIGRAVAGFEDVQEANERAAELASEWADRYVESGQRVATAAQQAAQIVNISTDPELYKEATENAKLWGVSLEDASLAMSGNAGAAAIVEDALERKRIATEKDTKAAQDAAQAAGGALTALTPMEVELNKAADAWRKQTDAMTAGAAQADLASDALLRLVEDASDATVKVDDLGNSVVTLPDGAEILIDAKTGKATTDVSRFGKDTDEVIRRLNGRDILLEAKANTAAAQRSFDRLIARNNGRTIQFKSRVISPVGGDL